MRQPFTTAILLSVAGLIPFILSAIAILFDPLEAPLAVQILISYGAVILSFIGAVHWGFALRETAHPGAPLPPAVAGAERQLLTFGVVPALVGWVALIAMIHFAAPALAVFLLLAGFFMTSVIETIGRGRGIVAGNYLALRWAVSVVVLVILLAVLFAILSGMRVG
jgi:hypothetical protein